MLYDMKLLIDRIMNTTSIKDMPDTKPIKRRIYITHCSAKKNDSLRDSNKYVTPDELYTSRRIQLFMNRCKEKNVEWAIFSDLYGVWFPYEKHEWYEKHPSKVTEEEFKILLENFDQKLKDYDEIWFYYNPGRFHSLYRRLLRETKLKDRIKLFNHVNEIE